MNKLFNTFFWIILIVISLIVILKLFTGALYKGMESEGRSGDLEVKVKYNSVNIGTERFLGNKVPYDIVWRTGSGDVTEIKFSKDCILGGKLVKAGSYSLWTIPRENDLWSLILNKDVAIYGTNYDPSKDILELKKRVNTLDTKQGNLRIKILKINKALELSIQIENKELLIPVSEKKV